MSKLSDIFTKEVLDFYINNKQEITTDLLDELRGTKEGKKIALKILDLPKDEGGFYLDFKGNQISYKKQPTLKGINTKLILDDIHKEEIKKCKEDIFYFMNNYIQIVTQDGVNFVDLRFYQLEFLECIINPQNESIVGLLPRQCINKDTNIKVNEKNTTIEDLFNESKALR